MSSAYEDEVHNQMNDSVSAIPQQEQSLDGLSIKSIISEAELACRDAVNHEIELEDIKEPEEEPYLYLDLKGDREEFGSRESVVSENGEDERVLLIQEMEKEDAEANITAFALATHGSLADPIAAIHKQDIDSNASEISENDARQLDDQIVEADAMMSDEVINSELEMLDRLVPVISPSAAEKKLPFPKHPKLCVYWHPDCAKHYIPDHPEQPARVKSILLALRNHFQDQIMFRECRDVEESILELFHTEKHVNSFIRLWEKTDKEYTKRHNVVYERIDGDTRIMWATKSAAFHAVGSVLDAIDHVFLDSSQALHIDTAFCCVRPPGHHAESNVACGFCFFNNAGIGAKYAQRKYGVKKVAVLDFDVHHGNGTEEGFKNDESLFYGSTHEKDNYPGTGTDPTPYVGENARNPLNRRIVNRTIIGGPTSVQEFHIKWQQVVDEMVLFAPELIIISAGFDAHDDDPLSNVELQERDFEWATEEILKAGLRINPYHPPKVISVLEGGYDLDAIGRSSISHVEVLKKGYFGVVEDEQLSRGKDVDKHFNGDAVDALNDYIGALSIT